MVASILHSLLDIFYTLPEYFLKQKLVFFPSLFKPFERFPLLVDEAKSLSTKNIADHLADFVPSHNTLHFPLKTATLILVLTIFIHPLPSAMGPLHILHSPDWNISCSSTFISHFSYFPTWLASPHTLLLNITITPSGKLMKTTQFGFYANHLCKPYTLCFIPKPLRSW